MLQTPTTEKRTPPLLIGPLMDRALQKAYKRFELAHAAMKAADTREAMAGSIGTATPAQKAAHKVWQRASNKAFAAAAAVMVTPCSSIEGMLLKIQVSGFHIADVKGKPAPFKGESDWTPEHVRFSNDPETVAMICSLRDDLRRLQRTAQN